MGKILQLTMSLLKYMISMDELCIPLFQWYTTIADGQTLQLYCEVNTGTHSFGGGGALVLMHDQDSVCE